VRLPEWIHLVSEMIGYATSREFPLAGAWARYARGLREVYPDPSEPLMLAVLGDPRDITDLLRNVYRWSFSEDRGASPDEVRFSFRLEQDNGSLARHTIHLVRLPEDQTWAANALSYADRLEGAELVLLPDDIERVDELVVQLALERNLKDGFEIGEPDG
jgi:hypothetical protein